MTTRYVLISSWRLQAPLTGLWDALAAVERWPEWWPQLVESRTLARGENNGVGRQHELTWRSGIGYRFSMLATTVRIWPLREIEGIVEGDLCGTGVWTLDEREQGLVTVTYRWDVRLGRPWMRVAAPLLRPLFALNHFAVMRSGAHGLAARLGCPPPIIRDWVGSTSFPLLSDPLRESAP